jgi:hypothetical protein
MDGHLSYGRIMTEPDETPDADAQNAPDVDEDEPVLGGGPDGVDPPD